MPPTRSAEVPVPAGATQDLGFTLIEVMVSISLLWIIIAATTTTALSSLNTTVRLQHQQVAAQLTTRAVQTIDAVNPQLDSAGCTKLLQGRTQSAVTAQWSTASSLGVTLTSDPVWASSACPTSPVVVPLTGMPVSSTTPPINPVSINGMNYTVRTYIGQCVVLAGTGCVRAVDAPTGSTTFAYQVVVAVTWSEPGCSTTACTMTATVVENGQPDQYFDSATTNVPVALPDTVCVLAKQTTAINIISNDTGAFGRNPVIIFSQPQHGTLGDLSTGMGSFTPRSGYHGTDEFLYRDVDAKGRYTSVVKVTINIQDTC